MAAPSSVRREVMAQLARIADLAHKLNRPSDMFELVNMMAEGHVEFNVEQRNLLITAYKIIFSVKRRALRDISVMEQQEDDPNCIEYIRSYREVLENDMQATCKNTLDIVENHLLPFCHDEENATLYHKMIGDAYWFLAMLKEIDNDPHVEKALAAYQTASEKAKSLSPADPMRLSVDLTKTAFYHDVMNWPECAYALGEQALDEARPKLDLLSEESREESTKYMKLMEENLKMWSNPKGKDPEDTSSSKEATSSYSTPFPVVQSSVPALLAPNNFTSPGDWGYDVHDGISANEIRDRKKAAQKKKGRMG